MKIIVSLAFSVRTGEIKFSRDSNLLMKILVYMIFPISTILTEIILPQDYVWLGKFS